MKILRILLAFSLVVFCVPLARGGRRSRLDAIHAQTMRDRLGCPQFRDVDRDGLHVGVIGNPNSYEIGAQFITARWRFGPVFREGFFRGYNQFYILGMVEPIFRGPENFYYGISVGLRYNFLHPGKPIHSLRFRRRRARVDRQPCRRPWRAGPGLHFQLSRRSRRFLQDQRQVAGDRRPRLPASFQWRTDRSESKPQSARATDRRDLLGTRR